ncbi:hypothetical protein [Streptomyces sp. Inha503]|uniref:hypothetical protein n=1 Tax=Streptomyces sp. Inha503 TaxID=3383314 RepID=UPI0039A1393A
MVAIALIGIFVGALTGTGLGMVHRDVGMTGDDFSPIGRGGVIGAMAGGVAGSGILAISAFFKSPRRKLVTATERVGRRLNRLVLLGGCLIPAGIYILLMPGGADAGDGLTQSLGGNITLLIICGVTAGVAAGVALGLIVGLLTAFSLAVVVLIRVSAGFLHSARKGPKSVPADLIGGACDPWPIRTAAALMPPEAGRRWRDDFNEARHDYEDDQHAKLLRDFLLHAPAVVVWAWIAALQRRVLGAGTSQERRW